MTSPRPPGMQRGPQPPCQRQRGMTAHGLPRPITLSPPERHRIFRQVFRILSGKYPEYPSPISAPRQHRKHRRQGLEPRHHHRRHRAKPDRPTPAMLPTARRFPLATESSI